MDKYERRLSEKRKKRFAKAKIKVAERRAHKAQAEASERLKVHKLEQIEQSAVELEEIKKRVESDFLV